MAQLVAPEIERRAERERDGASAGPCPAGRADGLASGVGVRPGPLPVTELVDAVGVEQSAVSHQLRLLRTLGLVAGSRQSRRVATAFTTATWLLDEAVCHLEHLQLGLSDEDPPHRPD
jgi:DNA-binding transcriptional ArsR family regulator